MWNKIAQRNDDGSRKNATAPPSSGNRETIKGNEEKKAINEFASRGDCIRIDTPIGEF